MKAAGGRRRKVMGSPSGKPEGHSRDSGLFRASQRGATYREIPAAGCGESAGADARGKTPGPGGTRVALRGKRTSLRRYNVGLLQALSSS